MSARYQLTIAVDSVEELSELVRQVAGMARPGVQTSSQPAAPPAVGVCTGGHGAMRLVPAGVAKSGPRIGQPYPAFYKCDTCGERQELPK